MFKSLLALIVASAIMPNAMANHSPIEPSVNGSIYVNVNMNLEQRVRELEKTVYFMDQRLRNLEDLMGPAPRPLPPPVNSSYTCMLVDSGYTKTFYAKGKSILEAEYEVKQVCSKTVNASYCQKVTKCSSEQVDPYVKGYFCMLTDSGYGKTFKGEGSDLVEAEAKAKIACQSTVNASYCGNVSARCEAIR